MSIDLKMFDKLLTEKLQKNQGFMMYSKDNFNLLVFIFKSDQVGLNKQYHI